MTRQTQTYLFILGYVVLVAGLTDGVAALVFHVP